MYDTYICTWGTGGKKSTRGKVLCIFSQSFISLLNFQNRFLYRYCILSQAGSLNYLTDPFKQVSALKSDWHGRACTNMTSFCPLTSNISWRLSKVKKSKLLLASSSLMFPAPPQKTPNHRKYCVVFSPPENSRLRKKITKIKMISPL